MTHRYERSILVLLGAVIGSGFMGVAAHADVIVQEGGLSGPAGPVNDHEIRLDGFDSRNGERVLRSVRCEFTTVVVAEAVTTGEGGMVEIAASLWADYFFSGGRPIAETEAAIGDEVDNGDGPVAILYLDEDIAEITYDAPRDLAYWSSADTVTLLAQAQLTVSAEPADLLDFFGSGMVRYRVEYHFDERTSCPADLDGNGRVDGGDVGLFFASWGVCEGTCAPDLNGDGLVDGVDLGALIAAWGICGDG